MFTNILKNNVLYKLTFDKPNFDPKGKFYFELL